MIEVTNLTKKYGTHTAVNNLSFTINSGEIIGFLGPNGAGKSTTMNILTGYLGASSGSVKINGIDILENPKEAKKSIGYLPEIPPLYTDMVVKDYLLFVAKLKRVPASTLEQHLDEIMELVKIKDVSHRLIKNLSKGYKQRIGLGVALIGSPDVLILDEPTVGLDPKQIIEIRNLVKEISSHHTIILSSHILSEVSAICDRVMIINKGELVASDTPENLSYHLSHATRLLLRVKSAPPEWLDDIHHIEGIQLITTEASSESNCIDITIETLQGYDIREDLFRICCHHNVPILVLKSLNASLEEIFLQITTDTQKEGATDDNDLSEGI